LSKNILQFLRQQLISKHLQTPAQTCHNEQNISIFEMGRSDIEKDIKI